jgi:soluble lytic murein transglycosylase-like protein
MRQATSAVASTPMAAARKSRAAMRKGIRTLLAAAFISSLSTLPGFASANPCEAEILRAADRHGVPAGILYAVGLTETGRKGSLHPNALNIAGRAVFARSRAEAVAEIDKARAAGIRLIDLGCMQINHHYHAEHFANVEAMLDPRRNVDYAARFLVQLKARHRTWAMAVARYHAGPHNDPAHKRYVCRVITNMVATGFGNWTPEARNFCNS